MRGIYKAIIWLGLVGAGTGLASYLDEEDRPELKIAEEGYAVTIPASSRLDRILGRDVNAEYHIYLPPCKKEQFMSIYRAYSENPVLGEYSFSPLELWDESMAERYPLKDKEHGAQGINNSMYKLMIDPYSETEVMTLMDTVEQFSNQLNDSCMLELRQ
jgi:hypothetical protein